MKLTHVQIERFKNVVDKQLIDIEDDVTCFIGKNESGKTTILKALHRLNPANGADRKFDTTVEYPRWRLSRDRRKENLDDVRPVSAWFSVEPDELSDIEGLPRASVRYPLLRCSDLREQTNSCAHLPPRKCYSSGCSRCFDRGRGCKRLLTASDAAEAVALSKELGKELREANESSPAKVLSGFPKAIDAYSILTGAVLSPETRSAIVRHIPKFFYFSTYDILPGECDLNELALEAKAAGNWPRPSAPFCPCWPAPGSSQMTFWTMNTTAAKRSFKPPVRN